MGDLWVVAEPGPDGGLANISAETATLVRELGATTGRDVVGIVVAADPAPAATVAGHVHPTGPDRHGRGRCRQRLVRGRGRPDRRDARDRDAGRRVRGGRRGRARPRGGRLGPDQPGSPW